MVGWWMIIVYPSFKSLFTHSFFTLIYNFYLDNGDKTRGGVLKIFVPFSCLVVLGNYIQIRTNSW